MTTTKSYPRIRLHSIATYDRASKARWLLTEMGIPYEERLMSREKREFESPEYLKLNPMGRAPVMEFGDQVIFESSAICAYLADAFLDRKMAPDLDSPDRAIYQQWMYFASATLDTMQTRIMIIEDIPAGEVQETKQKELQQELRDAMNTLDHTLARGDFLVAGRFSTADICICYPIYFCMLWPELSTVIEQFPRVLSYMERLKNIPSAVRANVFSYPA